LFAVAGEALEEGASGGVGEGFEEGVGYGWHGLSITNWLWVKDNRVVMDWQVVLHRESVS
jgi:hypothetical protein